MSWIKVPGKEFLEKNKFQRSRKKNFCPPRHRGSKKSYLVMDLQKINFTPSNKHIEIVHCGKVKFLLKYARDSIGIAFIYEELHLIEEIVIYWSQFLECKIVDGRKIEIILKPKFLKRFMEHKRILHEHGQQIVTNRLYQDPTGGCLENVSSIIFTPCIRVHPTTIIMFQACIQKFLLVNESSSLSFFHGAIADVNINYSEMQLKRSDNNRTWIFSNDMKSPKTYERLDEKDTLHITFVFFTHNRVLLLPFGTPFIVLVQTIHSRFRIDVNNLEYKNFCQEFITIQGEEDWKLAK
ncbi:14276_t:CDS:2, partial [Acaulospora morrowiae]